MRTAGLLESGYTPTLVVSGVIGAVIAENKSEKYAIPSTISIYPTYYQRGGGSTLDEPGCTYSLWVDEAASFPTFA